MTYQLVLQWPSNSTVDDYDQLIQIEERLVAELADDSEFDGHDLGSGEANIFILTDRPELTFDKVRRVLEKSAGWLDLQAAWRRSTVETRDLAILFDI